MIQIAWAALCLWPVVSIVLYRTLPFPVALVLIFVGGHLALPSGVEFDLPGLPGFDKDNIPNICALFAATAYFNTNRQLKVTWIPRDPVVIGLLILGILGLFGTAATNQDSLVFGPRTLRPHSFYDAFSSLIDLAMKLVPFLLGYMFLSSRQSQYAFLKVVVIAAVAYSFLALWEIRMSPQLHRQLYGFFPHDFAQHIRGGGFRPLVFMSHGLILAIFMSLSIIAATALARATKDTERMRWSMVVVWLFGVLILCKSLGALLISSFMLAIMLFLPTRLQALAALCIAVSVLSFPILRSADLVPVDQILNVAATIDEDRADSFRFRLDNEDSLLARALERPVFGWGDWGRQRIFNAQGKDVSITDGGWIIYLGNSGWVGYISTLGLLCWPVMCLFLRRKEVYDPINVGLALIICARLIDFIPNSGIGAIAWLSAGALLGRLRLGQGTDDLVSQGVPGSKQTPSYIRTSDNGPKYARDFSTEGVKSPLRSSDGRSRKSVKGSSHRRENIIRSYQK